MIIVLGVLLCRGGATEKAKLLFQEWDLDISGHVTNDDVDDMAQKIVQVAIDLIPQAFAKSGHLLGPVMISEIKAQGYREKLLEEMPRVTNRVRLVLGGS